MSKKAEIHMRKNEITAVSSARDSTTGKKERSRSASWSSAAAQAARSGLVTINAGHPVGRARAKPE